MPERQTLAHLPIDARLHAADPFDLRWCQSSTSPAGRGHPHLDDDAHLGGFFGSSKSARDHASHASIVSTSASGSSRSGARRGLTAGVTTPAAISASSGSGTITPACHPPGH